MARGKRHRRPHQQRQVSRPAHAQSPHDAEMDAMQQELVVELRRGLRSDTPLDLLAWVSGVVQSVEGEGLTVSPGDADLGDVAGFGPDGDVSDVPVTLRLLVESFEHTPFAETTAALFLIRAFTRDDEVRAAAGVALSPRRHPLPVWLARLDEVRATDVLHLTHVLGDGDDYLWGVRFADGSEVTVLVYVDHNLGGAVKDAFVIPDSVRSVSAYMVDNLEPGQHLAPTDAATARAAVAEALRVGDLFVEPLESESWPMQRPLVEWALRLLPDGGRAPEEREVAEGEMAAILDDFLAAPEGRALRTADERGLVELALGFASYHAGGADPLRWSPVSVEMLLLDFVPRKVMADSTYLLGLPDVLGPSCDTRTGCAASLRS